MGHSADNALPPCQCGATPSLFLFNPDPAKPDRFFARCKACNALALPGNSIYQAIVNWGNFITRATQEAPSWQPIATAPKTGASVLVSGDASGRLGWWAYWALGSWFDANQTLCAPTHWLPEAAKTPQKPLAHHVGAPPTLKAPQAQASQQCAPVEEPLPCPDCHEIPVIVQLSTEDTWIAGCRACNGGVPRVRGDTIQEAVRARNAHACGRKATGPPPIPDLLPCPKCQRVTAIVNAGSAPGKVVAGCHVCKLWTSPTDTLLLASLAWNCFVNDAAKQPSQASDLTPGAQEKQAKPTLKDASELLNWAEAMLCNAKPMQHCSEIEWADAVKAWRDEKHEVAPVHSASQSITTLLLDKLAAANQEIARLKQAPNINQIPLNPLSDFPCTRCGGEPSLRKFGDKSYVECSNCNNKTFPAISPDEAWWLWKTFSKSPKNPFEPRPK